MPNTATGITAMSDEALESEFKSNAQNNAHDSDIEHEWHALMFGIRRSIRYNLRRRQHFERWQIFSTVLTMLSGSIAFTSASGIIPTHLAHTVTLASSAFVAIISAFTLALSPTRKAWEHADFVKKFISLEKEMINSKINKDNLTKLSSMRLDIETTEPPVLHVLNTICHNELARSMGYTQSHLAEIGPIQRFFSPFFDWREHTLSINSDSTTKT